MRGHVGGRSDPETKQAGCRYDIRKGDNGKGIVLYDFLYCMGGAEQVTLDLARGLGNVDLCVAFRDRDVFDDAMLAGIPCHEVGRPARAAGWRTLSGMRAFARGGAFIDAYEWALFSGSNAPVAVRHRSRGRNFYYCHTVPRFVYDLRDYYLTRVPGWQRPLLRALIAYVQPRYEAAMERMDQIIANSDNVRRRIEQYLGRDATVVHPPCHVERYRWRGQGDYYLSTARLEPYKRVDLVVEAFRRMPDRRLVIASGGSQLDALQRLAEGADNIRFTGWIDPAQLEDLMGRAIATVYVPKDEDFGMSPVESMAAGKPVIGVAEGGLLETVVDGETGLLLSPDPTVEDVVQGVESLTPHRAAQMRGACEARAQAFRTEIFLERVREIIFG